MRSKLRLIALFAAMTSASTFALAQESAQSSSASATQQAGQPGQAGQSNSSSQAGKSEQSSKSGQAAKSAQSDQPGQRGQSEQRAQGGQAIQASQGQTGQPGQLRQGQGQAQRQGQGQGQGAGQAQGMSLSAFIAQKLKRGNEMEVELGQMAGERAKSDSVKEFAEMMVKSHTAAIEKLGQLDLGAAGQGGPQGAGQGPRGRQTSIQDGQSETPNAQVKAANPAAKASGSNGAGSTSPATAVVQDAQGQDAQVQGAQVQGAQGQAGRGRGGMGGRVPHMLVAIAEQSSDNELQMTKEMLQKHEGDDFDMAYIGQQIVAHTCMVAHLQALRTSGPQELQQFVTEGEREAREHLEHATKIAHELGSSNK